LSCNSCTCPAGLNFALLSKSHHNEKLNRNKRKDELDCTLRGNGEHSGWRQYRMQKCMDKFTKNNIWANLNTDSHPHSWVLCLLSMLWTRAIPRPWIGSRSDTTRRYLFTVSTQRWSLLSLGSKTDILNAVLIHNQSWNMVSSFDNCSTVVNTPPTDSHPHPPLCGQPPKNVTNIFFINKKHIYIDNIYEK